jgi:hypothetical protein
MLRVTQKRWWKMCGANMSYPVALQKADLSQTFVYDRELGFFYVPRGYHPLAMTILLSFHLKENDLIDMAKKLNLSFSDQTSERWLEGKGRCFKSSVSSAIHAGFRGNLSFDELQTFNKAGLSVNYILEDDR